MLRPELEDAFMVLVDAESAASPRTELRFTRTGDRHGARLIRSKEHHNYRIPLPDLEEMRDDGAIRLKLLPERSEARASVTAEGHRQAEAIRAREAASPGPPSEGGALDWGGEMFPVLQAVYRAYSAAPSPAGIRQPAINEQLGRQAEDERTDRVLGELAAAGYIQGTTGAWQAAGPLMCKLTEKGLQLVANWPSGPGEALATALLRALDEGIDEAESGDERNRLEQLREAAAAVGVNTLSAVLARLATGAM